MDKEYANRVFTRATVEDKHGDLCANDYDQTVPAFRGNPMTKEEEQEYLDLLLSAEEQGLENNY
jgi:hypothetical protein